MSTTPTPDPTPDILICLPAMAPDALHATVDAIATAFPNEAVLIASPDTAPTPERNWTAYPTVRANLGWVLAASDYAAAARLADQHHPAATLLIANENAPTPEHLRALAEGVRTHKADLVVPRFHLDPGAGLVNAAILYPVSRALFTTDIRFPLPSDAALSPRMAARLAAPTQRLFAVGEGQSPVWPVAEAAIAGLTVHQADTAAAPPPPTGDFNTLFNSVVSFLCIDIDTKANYWQRARSAAARTAPGAPMPPPDALPADTVAQIAEITESFHLAYSNLQEIWSLVLPPQTRLAIKKLSLAAPDAFTMEPALWARIVYDFALAFHLRTLNRNHLLGAMTPLYLAWAASHLRAVGDDPARAERSIQDTAAAFDSEKSYMVSRWRWPDRFNP